MKAWQWKQRHPPRVENKEKSGRKKCQTDHLKSRQAKERVKKRLGRKRKKSKKEKKNLVPPIPQDIILNSCSLSLRLHRSSKSWSGASRYQTHSLLPHAKLLYIPSIYSSKILWKVLLISITSTWRFLFTGVESKSQIVDENESSDVVT